MKRKNLYQILGEIKDDHILNGLVELKYQKGTNKEIDSAHYSTLSTQISSEFERYLSDLIDDESVFSNNALETVFAILILTSAYIWAYTRDVMSELA